MASTYVDENGVENVTIGIVKQARKDFIKGGKTLYGILKRIPTQKELLQDEKYKTLSNNESVRWMYDAWRFVTENPYNFFEDEASVINAWKKEAIEEHYKVLYLKGAEILFYKHVPKKDIEENDGAITKAIGDNKVAGEFIAARNYIFSLPEGKKILRSWNVIAYGRSRHSVRGKARPKIQDSEYIKNRSAQKQKNIKRAKEMYEEGISPKEIAEELGVTLQAVRSYLRS